MRTGNLRISTVLLEARHDTSEFDCGKPPLNDFLRRFALSNQSGGGARTYVLEEAGRVVAYYSLTPGSVERDAVPDRVAKGQAQHPIPVILLARLAIDKTCLGRGIGKRLFLEALLRAFQAHREIGGRAFIVDAIDDEAEAFYRKFDMTATEDAPKRLYLLFKDVAKIISSN